MQIRLFTLVKVAQNNSLIDKNGLLIFEFGICGPKWRKLNLPDFLKLSDGNSLLCIYTNDGGSRMGIHIFQDSTWKSLSALVTRSRGPGVNITNILHSVPRIVGL